MWTVELKMIQYTFSSANAKNRVYEENSLPKHSKFVKKRRKPHTVHVHNSSLLERIVNGWHQKTKKLALRYLRSSARKKGTDSTFLYGCARTDNAMHAKSKGLAPDEPDEGIPHNNRRHSERYANLKEIGILDLVAVLAKDSNGGDVSGGAYWCEVAA